MRIAIPANTAAEQRFPADAVAQPGAAVSAAAGEARMDFAAALGGLIGADELASVDAAALLPPATDGMAADLAAEHASGDGVSADGMAADAGAGPDAQLLSAMDSPLVLPIALPPDMPLPPAATPLNLLPGNAGVAAPAAPLPTLPAAAARSAPASGAEVLPQKAKAEPGAIAEPHPAATPEAAADAPAMLASTPLREPAAANAAPAVKLPAAVPEQWRRPLLEALGERIQVEVGKHSEQAVIRLDPPLLGRVEIAIRHQAGVLQVQLSASHDEVVRQLQHIGDSLRHDLSQRQYTDVSVQVFTGSRDGDGRQRQDGQPQERQPGRALGEAESDAEQVPSAFVLSSHGD